MRHRVNSKTTKRMVMDSTRTGSGDDDGTITGDSERSSKNATSEGISEAMRSAVESVPVQLKKNGLPYGVKAQGPRMTAKMRCFASCVAQGMSGREAYAKAYDAGRMSDASVVAEANKLMKDPRISVLMESVWETVEQNIIDDAVATRRKVMKDLLDHADNEKNRMGDRLKALEMMGRAIGMFTDKTEAKVETVDAEQLKRELDAHVDRFLSVKKAVH